MLPRKVHVPWFYYNFLRRSERHANKASNMTRLRPPHTYVRAKKIYRLLGRTTFFINRMKMTTGEGERKEQIQMHIYTNAPLYEIPVESVRLPNWKFQSHYL